MRRNTFLSIASAIALVTAAACSDVTVAPKSTARAPASASLNAATSGSYSTTFNIPARGGSVDVVIAALGSQPIFTLQFPADAVCSGPESATGPCDPVGHTVRVTATYANVNGHQGVDFTPEMRFDPAKVVTLSTMRLASTVFAMRTQKHPNWNALTILFTPDAGATLVNDALSDPSVITYIDLRTGLVWRRVKHFSGYNIGFGNCDPTVDPTCSDSTSTTAIVQ